jgi:hypothetical protein
MKPFKIAIIGGGSSYTPELVEGLIQRSNELPVTWWMWKPGAKKWASSPTSPAVCWRALVWNM